jgi:hypothetical protein
VWVFDFVTVCDPMDEENSKYAGLAQENGFGSAELCTGW